jgi:hypothetical protein
MKKIFKIFIIFIICGVIAFMFLRREIIYRYLEGFKNKGKLLYFDGKWKRIPEDAYKITDYNGKKAFLKNSLKLIKKAAGCSVHLLRLRREGGISPFRVYVFIFDPGNFSFSAKYRPQRSEIEDFFESNTIFSVNASFFENSGKVIGMVVSKGKVLVKSQRKNVAYFVVAKNKVSPQIGFFKDIAKFSNRVEEAVRGYPLIMHDGIVLDNVTKQNRRNRKISRRSVVANLVDGKVCFLVTDTFISGLSIRELPVIMGGLGARDALNLDGGGSTQSYFSLGGINIKVSGKDKVPVAINVSPVNLR